jgi:hypothetical protein
LIQSVVAFRIHYTDETIKESGIDFVSDWKNLVGRFQNDDVLVVRLYNNNNTGRMMQGVDYYFLYEDENGNPLFGQSRYGEIDTEEKIRQNYKNPVIINGRWTTDKIMDRVAYVAIRNESPV